MTLDICGFLGIFTQSPSNRSTQCLECDGDGWTEAADRSNNETETNKQTDRQQDDTSISLLLSVCLSVTRRGAN